MQPARPRAAQGNPNRQEWAPLDETAHEMEPEEEGGHATED